MTRNLSIWNDLRPFTIGFDDLFNRFDHYVDNRSNSFPPYNIVKGKDELNWMIEMALAGYNKKDIDINLEEGVLSVESKKVDDKKTEKVDSEGEILHKGIAKRYFKKSFTIADDVKVTGAELKDGLLRVSLERVVPEHKKPRTISIK